MSITFDRSISIFIFITFLCCTCKNLQHIFSLLSDNKYFYFSIRVLTRIFDAFICIASISLCFRVISRLFLVSFPIRNSRFSSTFSMSHFPLFVSKFDIFFGSSHFFEPRDILLFSNPPPLSYYIATVI